MPSGTRVAKQSQQGHCRWNCLTPSMGFVQAWGNIRPEFAEQLRQPLCLALLRNCTSPYDEAYSLVRTLSANMFRPSGQAVSSL